MRKPINCFILAAGLGERLRPITYHIPKPLLPILGKPMLQIVLEKVSKLPANKIAINLSYKRDLVEDWINQSEFRERIKLFPEEPVLGTGGALKNAEVFLRNSIFIVHNSDVLSDMDLEELLEYHLLSENLVTLAVHDYQSFNNLVVDEKGYLEEIAKSDNPLPGAKRLLAFTGVAIYSPGFLKFLPSGVSSVVDAWLNAKASGYKIGTLDVSGCYWKDIGTPSAYASAVFELLRTEGETVYIHPLSEGCRYAEMDGYVVIEKESILDKNSSFRNCIVLSPHTPPSLSENCIIGPDFKIDLHESDISGLSGEDDRLLIGTGGSDRRYYRIKRGGKTGVLMQCADEDPDFLRHIEYSQFFLKHSIPVPELIETEPEKMRAIFEDLGDISLYSWLKCKREHGQIENMYKKVLDIAIMIHTRLTVHVSECPTLQNRIFDYEHFRWETDYFIGRFVEGIKNIRVKNPSVIQEEFHRLALKADSFPKTVIHRDFQSQNIMIHRGIPRLVDYQGARIGLPAYDVASILWDPYYRIEDSIREHLVKYYVDKMRERAQENLDERDFKEALRLCRLQRHMQALGAYGFLSTVKGKKYFLKHIPEGLRLLKEDVSLSKSEYQELYNLIMGI